MIIELRVPYPDFKMGDLIDPEQHDMNNLYIQNKVNELVDMSNKLLGYDPTGASGASIISLKPIPPFTENKLQDFLDALIKRLTSTTAPTGASLIGTAPGAILTGATVAEKFNQIESYLGTAFVTTDIIRDGAVTNPKLAVDSVSESKIRNLSVTSSKLADNSVLENKLASGSVTTTKIGLGAVNESRIANLNVTTPKLADGSVLGIKIGQKAVATDKIADRAVTSLQIQLNTIQTENYAPLSITDTKIANRSITSSKIGTQQVKEEHLDPALLNYLPNTQLTAKVLALEARADQNDLKNHTQDLNITDNKNAIDAIITRLDSDMPLRFTKDGKTYSWGMRVVGAEGQVQMIYEEMI